MEKQLHAQTELQLVLHNCLSALKARNMWWYMGTQDVRNQFRRSKVGVGWIFINLSLMSIGIGYTYGNLFHQDLALFFPRLLLGIVLWTFIISTIVQGCQAFVISEGYIKQFPYPKQIYLLRFLVTTLINLLVGVSVYFFIVLIFSLPIHISLLNTDPGMMLLIR